MSAGMSAARRGWQVSAPCSWCWGWRRCRGAPARCRCSQSRRRGGAPSARAGPCTRPGAPPRRAAPAPEPRSRRRRRCRGLCPWPQSPCERGTERAVSSRVHVERRVGPSPPIGRRRRRGLPVRGSERSVSSRVRTARETGGPALTTGRPPPTARPFRTARWPRGWERLRAAARASWA